MDIKGKTAIITGSTGKLGRSIVLSLADAGVNCICVYNKSKTVARTLETAIAKTGVRYLFVQADISKPQGIEKVFAKAKRFSRPQFLINAAATFEKMPLEKVDGDYIRQTFDLNFTSAILMAQKFAQVIKKNMQALKPIGKIVNITDAAIQRAPSGYCIYSATKAALESATISLAKELSPEITVNAVAPGLIHWQKGMTVEQKRRMLSHVPANRTGLPEEIAGAVKFVIENDYITGRTIAIDGGWTL
jgi:NAD(P)-dependent dehydrogenase (short-subunit alcohol dehydrogenase family)